MLTEIAQRFADIAPAVDRWSIRIVEEHAQDISVRQDVLEPLENQETRGALVQVSKGTGTGYAATSDLSSAGLRAAAAEALRWAEATAAASLVDPAILPAVTAQAEYRRPPARPWEDLSLEDRIGLLMDACAAMKLHDRIVERMAWLGYRRTHSLLATSDGGRIEQQFWYLFPGLAAVANEGSQTQRRTGGGAGGGWQGGLERLAGVRFPNQARQVAEEALALLKAPECPSGRMDLVLMPDQMVLQIHESIGHPLELDRILGDERNYAGTSFVTPDMFGSYRYGSELLNVTFDPSRPEQLASYAFDDEGTRAERSFIIRDGILERPLGGATSQARAGLPGVACTRACDWNRPPIDRMANLNLEPGASSLDELIGQVENGILMTTNRSWSIDDSRNKFQFGCELGHLIEDGQLKGLVRNPNYRGISATFWRNLAGVGDSSTFEVSGTPNCGKGEPNQMIHVGHASPACLFRDVEVFGGSA